MDRRVFLPLALAAILATAAEARLASQRIVGTSRVCSYETRRAPGRPQVEERKVGLGERCPTRYRAPPAPPVRRIPADARLEATQRFADRTVCIYGRFGRRYAHPILPNQTCPRTAATLERP